MVAKKARLIPTVPIAIGRFDSYLSFWELL